MPLKDEIAKNIDSRRETLWITDAGTYGHNSIHEFSAIFELIAASPVRHVIQFDQSYFDEERIQLFAKYLRSNRMIQTLKFDWFNMHAQAWAILFEAMNATRTITKLIWDAKNDKTPGNVIALAMQLYTGFNELHLEGFYQIGDAHIQQLLVAFAKQTNLQQVHLTRLNVTEVGVPAFIDWLVTNKTLKTLSLQTNPIRTAGAIVFADILLKNKSLTRLRLSDCSLQAGDAIYFAESLKINKTLSVLELSNNKQLTAADVNALIEILQVNTTLQELNLRNCLIEIESTIKIADLLRANCSIKRLDLAGNSLGPDILQLFAALKYNNNLEELCVSISNFGDAEIAVIVDALRINKSLIKFCLYHDRVEVKKYEFNIYIDRNAELKKIADLDWPLTYRQGFQLDNENVHAPHLQDARVSAHAEKINSNPVRTMINLFCNVSGRGYFKPVQNDLLNALQEKINLFILLCIDPALDESDIANIDSRVASVELALATMHADLPGYVETCHHLALYYYNRAMKASDPETQKPFAKTALNYWEVCRKERGFLQKENSIAHNYHLLLMTLLGDTVELTLFSSNFPAERNIQEAYNLQIQNEKKPPQTTQPLLGDDCAKAIKALMQSTAITTVLNNLEILINRISDTPIHEPIQKRRSQNTLFQESHTPGKLLMALNAFKNALSNTSTRDITGYVFILETSVETKHFIDKFINSGLAQAILGRYEAINNLQEFAEQINREFLLIPAPQINRLPMPV